MLSSWALLLRVMSTWLSIKEISVFFFNDCFDVAKVAMVNLNM
jgi:hypothetical protein